MKKKRQTGKVIAVEMAEENDIQTARIEAGSFHGQQCCRPAIHEKEPVGSFNEITALIAPAAAEGISTAKNMKFHNCIQQ